MKTKRHLYILWSVLSLGLLSCAVDTYEAQFTTKKRVLKLGTPRSQSVKQSRTKSSQRSPTSTSSQRAYRPRSMRPEEPEAKIQSHFAYLPDVSVTCSTSDFVVRVKPAFYGLGADKEELKLGSSCRSNGVLRPYGDLLFTYPLTACDAVRQVRSVPFACRLPLHNLEITKPVSYLTVAPWLSVLQIRAPLWAFTKALPQQSAQDQCGHWMSLSKVRVVSQIFSSSCVWKPDVYNLQNLSRNHHVYQLTVKPTWKTAVVRKRLKGSASDFKMELMDGML